MASDVEDCCCQCRLGWLQSLQKDGLDGIGMEFGSEGRLEREDVG